MGATLQSAGVVMSGGLRTRLATNATKCLRILIVDDNKQIANGMARLLKTMGHEVHTELDSRSALRICTRLRPDLVLLDLSMPEVSGYDVCRAIRCSRELANTPVIAVTANDQAEDRRKSADAGFDAHLSKPLRMEDLHQVLRDVSR